MHENIKYTVALDKNTKALSDRSLLGKNTKGPKDEKADWQCIYGGKAYGTEFFVYAKFLGSPEGDAFRLKKIQLYLQNYSGPVSMGFTGFMNFESFTMSDDDPDIDERNPNYKKKYSLEFGVRGMNMENNFDCQDVDILLLDNDIMMAEPIFSPIDEKFTRIFQEEKHKADYVDELFMVRVGEDIVISPEGRSRLQRLYNYGYETSYNDKIAEVLEDAVNNELNIPDQKSVEDKNIKWPCRPINTKFRIIS